MLILQDVNEKTQHEFILSSVDLVGQQERFKLTSATYPELEVCFILGSPRQLLPVGYSVTVYLFKNPFHVQSQIIDLRISDRIPGNGKVGYMFNLEALFTLGSLQLDPHRYCYAYFGAEYVFKNMANLQTKEVGIKAEPYLITDFFDDDTIVLVLCNEYCSEINAFSLNNYLANLFLNGFLLLSKINSIEIENNHVYLQTNYERFTTTNPPSQTGVYVLRLERAKLAISSEAYIVHLFSSLIQKKFDQVTRFLMLYQVVEIFLPKIIHLEVGQRLCKNLTGVNSEKIKDLVVGLTKHSELITALLSRHAVPSAALQSVLRGEILSFFIHVHHPDYADPTKHGELTLTDLFYAFRNKIVHEYRILHEPGVDSTVTESKVNAINQLTEALVAETITVFKG
jgi:hypothetical protein